MIHFRQCHSYPWPPPHSPTALTPTGHCAPTTSEAAAGMPSVSISTLPTTSWRTWLCCGTCTARQSGQSPVSLLLCIQVDLCASQFFACPGIFNFGSCLLLMAHCIHSDSTFGWPVVTGIMPKRLLITLSVEQQKCIGDFHM